MPVIAILGLCLFLTGVSSAAITPYRGIVAIDGLGMSNELYAIVLALSSLGAAVGSVSMGFISDKIADRRVLIVFCALAGAAAYGLIFLVPSQLAYTIAVCVILPFGAALFSQSFAYARAFLTERNSPRAEFLISTLRSLFTLAWAVTPPIAGWIAAAYSVFHVFLIAALVQLACMGVFAFLLTRDSAKLAPKAPSSVSAREAEPALPLGRAFGLIGVALLRVALVVNLTVFPLVVTKDVGGSLGELGIAASIAAVLEMPLMIMWGYLATKWPKELIIIVSGLIFALYLVLLGAARSIMDVYLLQALNALSAAALLSLTISYVQEAICGRVGVSTSLIDVMAVIATFATAGLFALLATPDSYGRVLWAGAGVSLAGAIILLLGWAGLRGPSKRTTH